MGGDARNAPPPPLGRPTRKFLSDRGKIRSRRVTRGSRQQQRHIATAVRNAREMALLPYAGS
ncbi:30S ribosomal protein S18 [Streptomyces sp. NPDC048197]|uniref:30S ribosomal protein S18 n=1 Tax=Streptomyces sp. NPDC048197 TaxID=3365511 RepID=UPI0037242FB1